MSTLQVTRTGAVARVEMNRPEAHNAFNLSLIEELTSTIRQLGADEEVRVIVLAGVGKNFSAGADVEWMKSQAHATWDENRATGRQMAGLFETLDRSPKPIVARVQGAALGGGSGLVCTVDIAVASRDARFGFTEVRLGIIPAVISPFVIRRLGVSNARARFLTGERFGAEEALRIGMIHVLADDLDAEVDKVVQSLLACAPGALARTKSLVRQVCTLSPEDEAEYTSEQTAAARATDEGKEGLAAFLEKRKPSWLRDQA